MAGVRMQEGSWWRDASTRVAPDYQIMYVTTLSILVNINYYVVKYKGVRGKLMERESGR
jgi:hypothetical protein